MRTRLAACRQVQRADQAFFADLVAGDTVQRQPLREAGLRLRAGHAGDHVGDERIGHRVVEVFAAGRVHGRLRPDQAHGGQTLVVARDGRVAGKVAGAVVARRVGGLGLPEHAVAAGQGSDLHRLAGFDVFNPDLARHVDEGVRGGDG
ncbi:hypothetical protein G6F65_020075 [Rhizopus arrhizus]|nr:hypothetical protein G6F65_020075 [Rhizopus arrhizus]